MIDQAFTPFSLEGKTILVTGASSGIGKVIAIYCSKMGAKVIIAARNRIRLEDTFTLLYGSGHSYIMADLTKTDEVERLVLQLPVLDGVIHNAGVGSRVLCKSIHESDIADVMCTNFNAPVVLQSLLLSNKKIAKQASIVFLASKAAHLPSIGNGIYSASKGAIISYAKVLALELAARLIRVNCICPAMVWTKLILQDGISEEDLEKEQLKYPLKRYGTPEDIASLCLYLLSDSSSWMTGSCIELTGGTDKL